MRIIRKIALLSALFVMCLPISAMAKDKTMKGTWFSFRDHQAFLMGKSQVDFDNAFDDICDTVTQNGSNTLFVHVRSHNDAIYPSDVYPWSAQMLGSAKDPGFDPLSDMIKIAHNKDLDIHAWINPYGFRQGTIEEHPELATLDNILSGIREILENYDVDGIHFDDYFPPLGKDAMNDMVFKVHRLCKEYNKPFGISPQGNISNNIRNGVDVYTWLSSKDYVDYIAPQVYWTDLYGADCSAKSTQVLNEWKKINLANIPMYVGMGLYRAGNDISGDPGWKMYSGNLLRQWLIAQDMGYTGYILYDTQSQIKPNHGQKEELKRLVEK